jgi:hypothetical protein
VTTRPSLPSGLTSWSATLHDVDAVTGLLAASEYQDDGAVEIDRGDIVSDFRLAFPCPRLCTGEILSVPEEEGSMKMRRRMPAYTLMVAMVAAALVAEVVPAAAAVRVKPLIATKRNEQEPAGEPGTLAWSRNSRAHPSHYDVVVKVGGASPVRMNSRGTTAFMGGLDGSTAVFQQVRAGQSDIKLYDIPSGHRSDPPGNVNTGHWEYWPSLSGNFILFARQFPTTHKRSVYLFDRATSDLSVLASVRGRRTFLGPGQVNGDYATWYKCAPRCQVYRYRISTGKKVRVPNPGRYQYAPSVEANGTVFFGRSGQGCGTHVKLMRYPRGGPARAVVKLADGIDFLDTYAFRAGSKRKVLFDRSNCNKATSDIYQATLS